MLPQIIKGKTTFIGALRGGLTMGKIHCTGLGLGFGMALGFRAVMIEMLFSQDFQNFQGFFPPKCVTIKIPDTFPSEECHKL